MICDRSIPLATFGPHIAPCRRKQACWHWKPSCTVTHLPRLLIVFARLRSSHAWDTAAPLPLAKAFRTTFLWHTCMHAAVQGCRGGSASRSSPAVSWSFTCERPRGRPRCVRLPFAHFGVPACYLLENSPVSSRNVQQLSPCCSLVVHAESHHANSTMP